MTKEFGSWRVMRQDDNGNKFVIETGVTEDTARQRAEELAARGHKQTYWAERVPAHDEGIGGGTGSDPATHLAGC